MSFHRPLIASIVICGTLATGASFAQTTPATPSNPHPVQNAVPPTTPRPTTPPPVRSPTLPPPTSTVGVPQQQMQQQQMQQQQQQQELQRQQQNLRNGVQSNSDKAMHPQTDATNPASASTIH
ncbi:hypothetical protein ACPPVV_08730 [Rhodanobacter sp. Col0626]|uniref:hypothetical protein n=1 Tax=Rhodanobacter sp. Col0626 TaxID=3415679 RepID=UPI003CEB0E6D